MGEGLIASVVIKFNSVETQLKEIISEYISSDKDLFINEVLLNNSTINFRNKRKILKHIIRELDISVTSDFNKAMEFITVIRNSVAHSDKLNNIDVIDVDYDEDGMQTPIFGLNPYINSVENDEETEVKLEDKIDEFNKCYDVVSTELKKVSAIIKGERILK